MKLVSAALLSLAVLFAATARAEQSATFGDYTVHYNALTTNLLDPAVARAYGIVRSSSRALVNITVLRKVMGTTGQPVKAKVSLTATTLSNQRREVPVREVQDGGAIYYLGEIPVDHEQTLVFDISVSPEGSAGTHQVNFRQQFFTR